MDSRDPSLLLCSTLVEIRDNATEVIVDLIFTLGTSTDLKRVYS